MVRKSRPDTGNLDRLRQATVDHFDGSPIAAIGEQINAQLDEFVVLTEWDGLDDDSQQEFFRQCNNLLEIVPRATEITGRFWFDMYMIQAAFGDDTSKWIPGSILPRAASEWQYVGVHVPNFRPDRMPRLDIIDFPGRNAPEGINLLTYPWLYHEIGHLLLARYGSTFRQRVEGFLDRVVNEYAAQRLGKAQAVQDRLQKLSESVDRAWRPSANHTDWSHEIATDIIALWSCGPAFLAAYNDSLEGAAAHIIDDVHPPYEIRTAALIEAAHRLGWGSYTNDLAARLEAWADPEAAERNDIFLALRRDDLINEVVTAALEVCEQLGLPRCDSQVLAAAAGSLNGGTAPDVGRPLILAAWLKYEEGGFEVFHEWERLVVNELVARLIPNGQ